MVELTQILLRTVQIFSILFLLSGFQFNGNQFLPGQIEASPVSIKFLRTPSGIALLNKNDKNSSTDLQLLRYNVTTSSLLNPSIPKRIPRQKQNTTETPIDFQSLELMTAAIRGLRVEEVSKGVSYEPASGISNILANHEALVRLFGERFTNETTLRFVMEKRPRGSDCGDLLPATETFFLTETEVTSFSAVTKIRLPPMSQSQDVFYVCARQNNTEMNWIHQGSDSSLQIKTHKPLLPLWSQITLIVVLVLLSGLFSGLSLGLMSLDRTEMKIIAATGTEKERRYAQKIQPLRDNGNYLLCTLVLANVIGNSTLTILLDDLSSGLIAVIGSTISIVLFGEIIPQAICSRHGLVVGARTIWLTKFFMAITFPMAYPISVILDKILGEEIGCIYNRERLKELIRVTIEHNELETGELNIISGALTLKKKSVEDVMTPLADVFMLSAQTVLDIELLGLIQKHGFARIPIYDRERSRIISVLNTKDLVFVDSNEKLSLMKLVEHYNNTCFFVFSDATLDIMFNAFKTGNRGHMAFVQRLNTGQEDKDPFCETIGLLTLEDILTDWWPDRF